MEADDKLKESIRKWALKNVLDFKIAIPNKVIGRILSEYPQWKEDTKTLMEIIREECTRVNLLKNEQILEQISKYEFEEKKEEVDKPIMLPGAKEGHVITRFPPEPAGFLHIGHAKALFLNFEGAKNAKGYMRLRMDDTNPLKSKEEFVGQIVDDLKWLGVEWKGDITYTSDNMEKLYECADELILKHRAYVCTCTEEEVKKGRENGEECLCRAKFHEENLHEFRKMIDGKFEEGKAILRFRGTMKAENTVMRDPALFRIVKAPHYRQGEKYKCWPVYDFSGPIMDSEEGITHAIRSKEYELREELYYAILNELELRKPKLIHISRLAIEGAPVSKRLIAPLIEEGKVSGYDDPRLPTLAALRRKGIKAEAIRKFVLSFGLSKVESEPSLAKLYSENKKLVDGTAPRRFFAPNPAKVEISGVVPSAVNIKNHPQNSQMGSREILAQSPVYIPRKDADGLAEGETFRLKDWCNVKVNAKKEIDAIMPDGSNGKMLVIETEFVSQEGMVDKKVQWVIESGKVPAKIMVPGMLLIDGKYNENSMQIVWGWAEKACLDMNEREIMQFERFGFVVLDKKADVLEYIFISE